MERNLVQTKPGGEESTGTFTRKSVDFYDVPGSFEEPDTVSMSNASPLTTRAGPVEHYDLQVGGAEKRPMSAYNGDSAEYDGKKNKLQQPPRRADFTPCVNVELPALGRKRRKSSTVVDHVPSGSQLKIGEKFSSSIQERNLETNRIGSSSLTPAGEAVKERKRREKMQPHACAAVASRAPGSRYEKKARLYSNKAQSSIMASEQAIVSQAKSPHWKRTRYRDKMNKHSRRLGNEQEPLGTPDDPDQYFGIREPDILDEESSSPQEVSAVEEIEPGAVAMSFGGETRRLRKGRLTAVSGGLDEESVLVAMCARENGFEDEMSLEFTPKLHKWCGIRRRLVVLVMGLVAIAITVAVPLSLPDAANNSPMEVNTTEVPPTDANATEHTPTNFTLRREAFRAVISKFTNNSLLDEEGSPQNRALEWLVMKDELLHNFTVEQEPRVVQRYALSVLFFSTFRFQFLLPEVHECQSDLAYVSCDIFEAVTSIEIPHLSDGPLPAEIGLLSSLRKLKIYNCLLSSTVPTTVGLLTNLDILDLSLNSLISGSIPTELSMLSHLVELKLDNNVLSGSIPTELSRLTHLEKLYLWKNELTGLIPTDLSSLSELGVFEAHHNLLSGSFPDGLCTQVDKGTLERPQVPCSVNCSCCEVVC